MAGSRSGEDVHSGSRYAVLHFEAVAGRHLPIRLTRRDQRRHFDPVKPVEGVVGLVGMEVSELPATDPPCWEDGDSRR